MLIETGIPLPPRFRVQNKELAETLTKMNEEDSVLVPDSRGTSAVAPVVKHVHLVTGKKFTARKVEGGVRIWCVSCPPPGDGEVPWPQAFRKIAVGENV